jgi:HEAT repeat protein
MPDPAANIADLTILTAESRAALDRLEELAGHLVAALQEPELDEDVQRQLAELIIEAGPAAVTPLVELLAADPQRGRELAAPLLCAIGEPSVDALVDCFQHNDPEVRATAAYLFTALHDVGRRAEELLIGLLDDDNEHVRQSACYALSAMESLRAVPKLIALATRPADLPDRDLDPEGWSDAYPYDSAAAVDALGQIGDPRGVGPLLFIIEAEGVRGPLYEDAVGALARMGDPRAAEVVRSAYDGSPYEGQFTEALVAMHGRDALTELLELAVSDEPVVRRQACEPLVALGSVHAAGAVCRLLCDNDPAVRAAARDALSEVVDSATAQELLAGLDDVSAEVRAWTVALLPVACAWSE